MASVNILQHHDDRTIVLVPFATARDSMGGSVASGKLIRLSYDEFLSRGAAVVMQLFADYWVRDPSVPSELYNEMSTEERERFLANHTMLIAFYRERKNELGLFDGVSGTPLVTVQFPPDEYQLLEVLQTGLSQLRNHR